MLLTCCILSSQKCLCAPVCTCLYVCVLYVCVYVCMRVWSWIILEETGITICPGILQDKLGTRLCLEQLAKGSHPDLHCDI